MKNRLPTKIIRTSHDGKLYIRQLLTDRKSKTLWVVVDPLIATEPACFVFEGSCYECLAHLDVYDKKNPKV